MELSKRLNAVASLVTPGNRLADVGTDHGYIPIYLVKEKKIPCAIAMDVNKGPLLRAQEHIGAEHMENQIATRLSDGLEALLPGEADTAVLAGMGGALTMRILQEGSHVLPDLKELILQPQSEIFRVRYWLAENGFQIADEEMVQEDGKYYPMMRVIHGTMKLEREIDAWYGPVLLRKKHPCLLEYLRWERNIKKNVCGQLKAASGEAADRRREEIDRALLRNCEAVRCILNG